MTVTKPGADETASVREIHVVLTGLLRRVAAEEITPAAANAGVAVVAAMLRPMKLQMEYARAIGKAPHIPFLATEEGAA